MSFTSILEGGGESLNNLVNTLKNSVLNNNQNGS